MLFVALGALAGPAAVAGLVSATPAAAAEEIQGVRDILFESDHLDDVAQGVELKYTFERNVSEPKLLGPEYTDEIKVAIAKVHDDGKRDVDVDVFSGDRARDTRHLPGMTANPILVFYLDRAVSNFAMLAGGSKGYLKNRFRLALRTTAKIEPAKIDYNGKVVEVYHVWVKPYVNDTNKEKMSGYENARFDVFVSDEVPGFLVEMKSKFESAAPGAPELDERIVLDGARVAK
jgi:hypothetical protein